MFGDAAERLGVTLMFASDRCDQLEDPWYDQAIPIRFHQEQLAADAIARAAQDAPIDGILAVGDRPTVIAAVVAERLGLPGNALLAAHNARDKRLTREALREAGLPVPRFVTVPRTRHIGLANLSLRAPLVIKPAALSGSRGVIRANDAREFDAALVRVQELLASKDVRAMQDPATDEILIEEFIPGREYALEGLLTNGKLHPLAIFDKPEPLDGPFFEETIYVTPSGEPDGMRQAIISGVAAAAGALGLRHGPIHAECRVNVKGVFVLEVAARPIGGLCAKALQFIGPRGQRASLEDLLLRHALGDAVHDWHREDVASGVMMIPIPYGGIYRRVNGIDAAATVKGISGIHITAKPDQQLVPLPEGASYLGFVFAKAPGRASVVRALHEAHDHLEFVIDRKVPIVAS